MKKILLILILIFSVSCASKKPPACASVAKSEKDLSADQRLLNHGYATIYGSFKNFKWLDKLLLIKMETQEVHDLVDDLHKTGQQINEKFEALQKKYPNLKVDETGRSETTILKAKEQTKDRFASYMPVVGKSGKEFERSLVLFISQSTSELKYLSEALEKIESNASLKKFNREIQIQSMRLEDRALKLLNEKYFKDNFFKAQTLPKN